MKELLRVLLVEDSADDAALLLLELQRDGDNVSSQRVDTVAGLVAALEAPGWDIVISDYQLPEFNGLESLRLVRARWPDVPFILVSGAIGEETAVAVMKAGANDYLNKSHLARLVPAVQRELREAELRRYRQRAEAELAVWQRELEARVEERTAALTRAHQELKIEIDERKRLEAEIARVSEREQLRLGQELHDGLGQQLTGISYLLTVLHDKLKKVDPARARETQKVQTLIHQSIAQAHNLAKGFYPVEMERHGLLAALKEITTKPGLPARIAFVIQADADPALAELKGPLAIQLFRITQEAVHNAVKHARAKRIMICLATIRGNFTLTVKDDGVGLAADFTKSGGMGLRIMQHRARLIGGTLEIRNGPDGGMTVTCSVPVQELLASRELAELPRSNKVNWPGPGQREILEQTAF